MQYGLGHTKARKWHALCRSSLHNIGNRPFTYHELLQTNFKPTNFQNFVTKIVTVQ